MAHFLVPQAVRCEHDRGGQSPAATCANVTDPPPPHPTGQACKNSTCHAPAEHGARGEDEVGEEQRRPPPDALERDVRDECGRARRDVPGHRGSVRGSGAVRRSRSRDTDKGPFWGDNPASRPITHITPEHTVSCACESGSVPRALTSPVALLSCTHAHPIEKDERMVTPIPSKSRVVSGSGGGAFEAGLRGSARFASELRTRCMTRAGATCNSRRLATTPTRRHTTCNLTSCCDLRKQEARHPPSASTPGICT